MKSRVMAAALLMLAVFGAPALAWWHGSHALIDRAAVLALPADLPEFFRQGAETIAANASEPDFWKHRDLKALRAAEHPEHFIDLELFGDAPVPPTRAEFDALCRRKNLEIEKVGALPYAIVEWTERLTLAFAEHRLRPEDAAVRAKVLYLAGVLSHYSADAAQPLHTTIHYDGRANAAGESPRSGIHNKMDALPVSVGLGPAEIAQGLAPKVETDIFAAAMKVVVEAHAQVEPLYALEGRLPDPAQPPAETDPAVRALALDAARRAAALTASLWTTAWANSAKLELTPEHKTHWGASEPNKP